MPLIVPAEIRFSDYDLFGHVNNAAYLTILEQARFRYFNRVIATKNDWQSNGIILAKVEIEYLQPVFPDDQIFISLEVSKLGTKSFEMQYKMFEEHNNEIIKARAKTIMVCYDHEQNKTIEIPESWKKAVLEFENISLK